MAAPATAAGVDAEAAMGMGPMSPTAFRNANLGTKFGANLPNYVVLHRARKIGVEVQNSFKKPQELFAAIVNVGTYKAKLTWDKTFILGFLAGAYIALAMMVSVICGGGMPTIKASDPGLQKYYYAVIFPVGIILVVIAGAELVTGNFAVVTAAWLARKISLKALLRNWAWAYVGNFFGSIFVAYLLAYYSKLIYSGVWASFMVSASLSKMDTYNFGELLLRGIGCNWLVCLGVYTSYASEDITGKILALWFPICSFILIGFEHSVFNMGFMPLALIIGNGVNWNEFFLNLVPVTIGNIIAGAFLVALPYWWVYWNPAHDLQMPYIWTEPPEEKAAAEPTDALSPVGLSPGAVVASTGASRVTTRPLPAAGAAKPEDVTVKA